MKKSKIKQQDPKVKDILDLLIKGSFLTSLFLFPGAAIGIAALYDVYEKLNKKKDFEKWNNYKPSRLRYALKRLHEQKFIKVINKGQYPEVHLTKKGNLKVLSYKLDEMSLSKPKKWDRKWRIIIYDVKLKKKNMQVAFRRMLKKLDILALQKSVYLTPYQCEEEIEFLREYFNIGKDVILIIAEKLENEKLYKAHFNLS